MARWALIAALAVAPACSSGAATPTAPEAPAEATVADVRALFVVLDDDPALPLLEDVDAAIAENRPVLAADLIGRAAVPAVREHVDAIAQVATTSAEGRTFRERAVRAYRARITALEGLARLLARAEGESVELLEAMHAESRAEVAILRLHEELGGVLPAGSRVAADETRRLAEDVQRDPRTPLAEEEPAARPDDPNPAADQPAEPQPER